MAPFKAPGSFDFSQPGLWPLWKTRWERYFKASKLNKEDDDVQVNTLIYVMGVEAEQIFDSFKLSDADQKKTDVVW